MQMKNRKKENEKGLKLFKISYIFINGSPFLFQLSRFKSIIIIKVNTISINKANAKTDKFYSKQEVNITSLQHSGFVNDL